MQNREALTDDYGFLVQKLLAATYLRERRGVQLNIAVMETLTAKGWVELP